ncbi:MAG: hypothetical protein H6668_16745 [Ardenticatenaceae bacterium]|nr:hypothetical protein [Ardenticatenaceae bacterium]
MSLGIVINGPEGVVLAADSRLTITVQLNNQPPIHASFDNATKLLSFESDCHQHVGAVTYGQAAIGLRTAHSYMPEFEQSLPNERLTIIDYATKLSKFFLEQWRAWQDTIRVLHSGPSMTFVVSGFDENDPYGTTYLFEIPSDPAPRQQNGSNEFGIVWGGQRDVVDRILQGYDQQLLAYVATSLNLTPEAILQLREALHPLTMNIPIQAMALQDCVDLATFFIRTTIEAQSLTVGIRGVGGAIEVATIRKKAGFAFVSQKKIVAKVE